jgi:hypothetical protein
VRWYQNPMVPALVGAVFGTVSALLSTFAGHDNLLQIAVGILVGVATLQLGELWQIHARTPRMSRLEGVLSDEVLFKHVETLLDANSAIEEISRHQGSMAEFFRKERQRCLGRALFTLEELKLGRIRINDPDTQYQFAVDLAGAAKKKIETVSYRDEEFWTLAAGERYLQHNEALTGQKGTVERVFIYEDEDSVLQQRDVVRRHIAKKVTAYILPVNRVTDGDRKDYVIYDDRFVRYAETVGVDGSRKTATLDVNELKVEEYRVQFRNLVNRSIPAETYIQMLEASSESEAAAVKPTHENAPSGPGADPDGIDPSGSSSATPQPSTASGGDAKEPLLNAVDSE